MAIIVEDGTGITNADSYASVADLDAYATHRLDVSGYSTAQKEAALVIASADWLDGYHNFRGDKLVSTQGLHFPTDEDAFPDAIVTAALKAALLQLQGLLLVDLSSVSQSGDVESESKSLGSLSKSVTYKSGTARTYSRTIPKDLTGIIRPYFEAGTLGVTYRL